MNSITPTIEELCSGFGSPFSVPDSARGSGLLQYLILRSQNIHPFSPNFVKFGTEPAAAEITEPHPPPEFNEAKKTENHHIKHEAPRPETMLSAAKQALHELARLTELQINEPLCHLERISCYTELLARGLAKRKGFTRYLTESYIHDLAMSSVLHDVGKAAVPKDILLKPDRLSAAEFEALKRHTTMGRDIIDAASRMVPRSAYLKMGRGIALSHHERWDGSGYPRGLHGRRIPLSARIVAAADVYDALTSRRPYKCAFSHEAARDYIVSRAGSHFDSEVVRAFSSVSSEFESFRESL